MSVNVKALIHWAIYKGYKLRFTRRAAGHAAGVLTTAEGVELPFAYDAAEKVIQLPDIHIHINDYGWEVRRESVSQ